MIKLYLDSSVIEPIAQQSAGNRIKALLQQRGAVVFASMQNLVEAWRIPDPATRGRFVRAILQVARTREVDPMLHGLVVPVINELRRNQHHEWLLPQPRHTHLHDLRILHHSIWERLKADPAALPDNPRAMEAFVYHNVGDAMQLQRLRRQAMKAGPVASPLLSKAMSARLQPMIDRVSEAEAYWRQSAASTWWNSFFNPSPGSFELRNWLAEYLIPERLELESWMTFWLVEADRDALILERVYGFFDFFQSHLKVDSGNWGDLNHVGFAVGRDYFLTADKQFNAVMERVRNQPDTPIARPVLIDRASTDIVSEIRSGLGW
ncbi:MAG TPA: hypothetical protein VHK65_06355 [Candidatus Dormibacteraeota bacterium]|nr:hypothetical protein [Candidatus Dormibacteraeota bacterium]